MTDSYIPEEIIDRVVEQIAELDNDAVRAHMKRCGPFQPELTGFVLAYMADRLDLVRALSTIGMITAYEAFRAGYVKTRKARERLVKRTWEDVADFIAQLADQFHRPHHLSDDDLMSSEPALMGALMELAFAEGSETAAIPADDAWHLLAVLYNIVETLHESAGAPRFPAAVELMDEPDAASMGTGITWYTPEQWERSGRRLMIRRSRRLLRRLARRRDDNREGSADQRYPRRARNDRRRRDARLAGGARTPEYERQSRGVCGRTGAKGASLLVKLPRPGHRCSISTRKRMLGSPGVPCSSYTSRDGLRTPCSSVRP
jgi:hypothetical protein